MSFFYFFLNYLHLKKVKNKTYIYCVIRKKFYTLTQEEVIRQYIIFLLKKVKNYKNSNLKVEIPFQINKLNKRLDLLVHLKERPYILIECKAPNISITQKTFNQISYYNKKIKAPYLMVSNGIKSFIFQVDKYTKKFLFLNHIP
ncbi:type I restriction enzyme HsdR N-terminal domain-containing protein [Blattabacterium cuenoti]|uniref:type I restriction enzyme HsdR N-terminal domain-containing protein n=1 Tax=Blattabacterium cuenoti TaxID=1653831 RepID=UPI00163B7A05|nr:type I restriction enzyme HsdR N-terminal domain-containing protein [Blattabacterium cuenoti]